MSDSTNTPTPMSSDWVELRIKDTTGAIKQFFRSLNPLQAVVVGVITLVLVGSLVFAITSAVKPSPKPLTPAQLEWSAWYKKFKPVYVKSGADYYIIVKSLSNNTATSTDFTNLASDALALTQLGYIVPSSQHHRSASTSNETAISSEVTTLATNLQQLSSDGIAVYAGGGSMTAFENDIATTDAQFKVTTKAVLSTVPKVVLLAQK